MEELAERVHGDIRMALNHLQYMSLSQSVVKYDDIRERLNSSSKDEDISPFTAVDKYCPFFSISSTSNIIVELFLSFPFIFFSWISKFLLTVGKRLFNFRLGGREFMLSVMLIKLYFNIRVGLITKSHCYSTILLLERHGNPNWIFSRKKMLSLY